MALPGLLFPKSPRKAGLRLKAAACPFSGPEKESFPVPRQRFVVAGAEDTPCRGRASADGMLPAKKADMTITAMSAFPYLFVCGDLPVPEGISYTRRTGGPAEPAGFFPVFHTNTRCPNLREKGRSGQSFLAWRGSARGGRTFCPQKGSLPLASSFYGQLVFGLRIHRGVVHGALHGGEAGGTDDLVDLMTGQVVGHAGGATTFSSIMSEPKSLAP